MSACQKPENGGEDNIFVFRSGCRAPARAEAHLAGFRQRTANLDFGGFDSSRILTFKGWISEVRSDLFGHLEPAILSPRTPGMRTVSGPTTGKRMES